MQLFTNNGSTTLANAVLVGDTTITVVDASKFPAGNFKVTLEAIDRSVNEIMLVTGVAGNVLTVTRAQEGTVASGFAIGSKVEVRVTAEFLNDLQALVEGVVDDTVVSTTKTWSSSKVSTELGGKAETTHSHLNATTSTDGFMSSADKTKLDGVATGANNYVHPTGDGNLHVPATGTTNNGKVLTAGATAGSLSWTALPSAPVSSVAGKTGVVTLVKADVGLGNVDNTSDANKPVSTATQTALNAKQNTITGAATTITSSNLTASMAMVTDASGKVAAHGTVSSTELGYLDGVTSAIQTQLNGKEPTIAVLPVSKGGTGATTLTGLVKGNGTGAMTAAVSGTDYQAPLVSGTSIKTVDGNSLLGTGNVKTIEVGTIFESTKYSEPSKKLVTNMTGTGATFAKGPDRIVLLSNTDSAVSYDGGDTWSTYAGANTTKRTSYQLIYNDGYYFAAAAFAILRSTDGISWTSLSIPTSTIFNQVVFVNGLLVVAAQNGNIYYSSNLGSSWTTSPNVFGTSSISYLVFGNGIYAALSGSGLFATSTDGMTWTLASKPPQIGASFSFVNGEFIAVKASAAGVCTTSVSKDLVNWKTESGTSKNALNDANVYIGSGGIVSIGNAYAMSQYGNVAISFDKKNWTYVDVLSFLTGLNVSVGTDGLNFFAVSNSNAAAYRFNEKSHNATIDRIMFCDGSTYAAYEFPELYKQFSTTAIPKKPGEVFNYKNISTDGLFCANNLLFYRKSNDIYFSNDFGNTFNKYTFTGNVVPISEIYYYNNKYFVLRPSSGGYVPSIYVSSDNLSSFQGVGPTNSDIRQLLYVGGVYYGYSSSNIYTSSDGITWTSSGKQIFANFGLAKVIEANGLFFAVNSSNGNVAYSVNGLDWTEYSSGVSWVDSLLYENGVFYIGGASGALFSTTDGITLTPISTGVTGGVRVLGTVDDEFLIAGYSDILATTDFISWTTYPNLPSQSPVVLSKHIFARFNSGTRLGVSTKDALFTVPNIISERNDTVYVIKGA